MGQADQAFVVGLVTCPALYNGVRETHTSCEDSMAPSFQPTAASTLRILFHPRSQCGQYAAASQGRSETTTLSLAVLVDTICFIMLRFAGLCNRVCTGMLSIVHASWCNAVEQFVWPQWSEERQLDTATHGAQGRKAGTYSIKSLHAPNKTDQAGLQHSDHAKE